MAFHFLAGGAALYWAEWRLVRRIRTTSGRWQLVDARACLVLRHLSAILFEAIAAVDSHHVIHLHTSWTLLFLGWFRGLLGFPWF